MTDVAVPAELARVLKQWNPAGAARLDDALRGLNPEPRLRVIADEGLDADAWLIRLSRTRGRPLPITDAGDAAVVLVILDAATPIGRAMLTELRSVPEAARVVLSMDRTERHTDWREVRSRTRGLIDRYVSRLAAVPIVVGADALAAAVEEALTGDDQDWIARNAACALDHAVDGARRAVAGASRHVGSSDDVAALRRKRTRLLAERDGHRLDRITLLRSTIAMIRVDVTHAIGVEARALASGAVIRVGRAGGREHAEFVSATAHDIGSAADRVRRTLDSALTAAALPTAPLHTAESGLPLPAPSPRRRTPEDWLTMALGLSAGIGLGRVASLLVPAAAQLPLTVVVAIAVGCVTAVLRDRASARSHLRAWAGEVIADARSGWEQSVASTLLQAETDAAVAISVDARARSADTDADIGEIDDALRAATAGAAGRSAGYERDLAAIERGTDAVRQMVERRMSERRMLEYRSPEPNESGVRPTR